MTIGANRKNSKTGKSVDFGQDAVTIMTKQAHLGGQIRTDYFHLLLLWHAGQNNRIAVENQTMYLKSPWFMGKPNLGEGVKLL